MSKLLTKGEKTEDLWCGLKWMGKVGCYLSFELFPWALLFIYSSDFWEDGDRVDRIVTKPGAVKLP